MIWGRLLGTLLGLRLLGFFGAIMGFWIGSWFDKGLHVQQDTERQAAARAFQEWFSAHFDPYRRSQENFQENPFDAFEQRWQTGGAQSQTGFSGSHTQSLENAYAVLGVKSSATPAEIKKAYRRLMNQHHPDKLAARGLPEEMAKAAKEKTQEIHAAYDMVRKTRGFR